MSSSNAPAWSTQPNPYPTARRDEKASQTYKSAAKGSVTVPEPYIWLEQPPSQSEETKEWVHAQAKLTQTYLDDCQPDLDILKSRIEKNFDFARFSCPSLKGDGQYYYSYNSGLSPQSLIYTASKEEVQNNAGRNGRDPIGKIFFDSNLLSADGTVALSFTTFSHSGKYMAYGISKSGSDWTEIFVRETVKPFKLDDAHYNSNGTIKLSKEELAKHVDASGGKGRLGDQLENVKFSGATFTHDDKGLFYQTYPSSSVTDKGTETDANKDAQLWYHRIGSPQSEDVLVISKDLKAPESMWSTNVSHDGNFLMLYNSKDTDTKERVYVFPLHNHGIDANNQFSWIPLALSFKYVLNYITNKGNRFYFMTNKDAPNYRLVSVDIDPSKALATKNVWELTGEDAVVKDVIAEDKNALLGSVQVIDHNKLLVVYSRDVKDELYQYELETGKRVERLLPDLVGTIDQIAARHSDDHAFVKFGSFVNPGQVVRLNWETNSAPDAKKQEQTAYYDTQVEGIKANDFVSEQVFIKSKDGTRVPMFVTHPKTVQKDGTAPAILYFYGGFNISITPVFSPSMMSWISSYNGVLAFVNCRGGGEYGDKWHEAGTLLNKQNVFDDALSAAKYLHESGYAAKGKIILSGGSNGGLGVAACINQQLPEHGIGAGIADVGVMDMLKFHTWTIGHAWKSDYGNVEDPEMFDYLYRYSPLHNVDGKKVYPTTVLACADHDDRVVPAHSFKLMAEMQHKLASNPNPLLLRVEIDAGHGAGKSTQKRIQEATEKYAIVARALGLKIREEGSRL
ncbi:related to Prolyl endopeptidase [Ustilago bromivora]|uniref:Prolyl endopeptidase n=1 Tax=Ustilago bromivora TaxID=307758 RepID=A0A1K0HKB0_9BASI|nr:related to Prolyl endopeptidase [Ustilago bromivora]SYW79013.1 related to Prolyl endopeptidase [Ustilago bromivora]